MKNKIHYPKLFIILVCIFFLSGYIIYPLIQLLKTAGSSPGSLSFFSETRIWKASFNSILLAIASVIGSAIAGTYLAYVTRFKKIWFGRILSIIILLPVAIPPVIGVMSYLFLLGDNGILVKILNLQDFHFHGWSAILPIHIYSFYPLFYLFVSNALKSIDNSLIEASLCLGAGQVRTFFKIILPQTWKSISGAALLVFMASITSFSAPFIFGGSIRFLTTEIYYSKINGDMSSSAILSVSLIIISLITLLILRYIGRTKFTLSSKGTPKKNSIEEFKKTDVLNSVICLIIGIIILLPVLSMALLSVIPENSITEPGIQYSFTTDHYSELFSDFGFSGPLLNSIKAAFIAVLLTAIAGLLIAQIIQGKKSNFKLLIESVSVMPYAIPGTVLAICLILSFNQGTVFSFNQILVGSFWILPIAFVIRNLPIMTQSIKAALNSIDHSIQEASVSLGGNYLFTWRHIVFPMIIPAIIDAGMLVFIHSMGEFVASVLLYNYSSKTMPIEIYSQMRLSNTGTASACGMVLFFLVIGFVILIRKKVLARLDWRVAG